MSHIYTEKEAIPIPENAYIDITDARVFIFVPMGANVPLRYRKRMNIGKAASKTMMYPNDSFRLYFPHLWEKYYGPEDSKFRYILHPGMYALTLGVCYGNGLYETMLKTFGPKPSNRIIDYAMYMIMTQSNVSLGYGDRMMYEVMFSQDGGCSDTLLSAFFAKGFGYDTNYDFRSKWLDKCVANGVTKAWISIDGSNNDCVSQSCALALSGEAKSGKNVSIVSYMYAVCAETGIPLTYDVYHGNMVDSKAFEKIIAMLTGHNIQIQGFILDRGFAYETVLDHIRSLGYPFVVMLKSDTWGYSDMMESHWQEIKVNVEKLVSADGIFGVSEQHRIFKNSADTDFVNLYYDMNNGTARACTLIGKVLQAKKEMEADCLKGKEPHAPQKLQKYFNIHRQDDGAWQVETLFEIWQKDVDMKGFSAIGSSNDFGVAETNRIYKLRNCVEVQFKYIKTQLGSDVTRVHSTDSIVNKFMVCFVASVIRNEIERACKKHNLKTNAAIKEVDRIEMLLHTNRNYIAIHNESDKAKTLLACFDILPQDFDTIAAEVTERLTSPFENHERTKPNHDGASKRRPGRPKGSGKKQQQQSQPNETPCTETPAANGDTSTGSSFGGQNSNEREQTASDAPANSEVQKRSPGRPKGSKNKKTLEIERLISEGKMQPPAKGKAGRPKGSKNKPKDPNEPPKIKRKPGRPKGAKNKNP